MKKNPKPNGAEWQPERPFSPLPLSLMESPAWKSLIRDPSGLRLVLFLVREWARHRGQKTASWPHADNWRQTASIRRASPRL